MDVGFFSYILPPILFFLLKVPQQDLDVPKHIPIWLFISCIMFKLPEHFSSLFSVYILHLEHRKL